jgi:hypothetical protein
MAASGADGSRIDHPSAQGFCTGKVPNPAAEGIPSRSAARFRRGTANVEPPGNTTKADITIASR